MTQTKDAVSADNNDTQVSGLYDPLTELYNKPLFIQVMESLLRISMRQRMPVSLVIACIDHYSELREKYGLPQAHHLIKSGADTIKSLSRDSDILAHFEESQFALLLYNCNQQNATKVTERLCSEIESNLSINDEKITFNVGLSTFGETNDGNNKTAKQVAEELISGALRDLSVQENTVR